MQKKSHRAAQQVDGALFQNKVEPESESESGVALSELLHTHFSIAFVWQLRLLCLLFFRLGLIKNSTAKPPQIMATGKGPGIGSRKLSKCCNGVPTYSSPLFFFFLQ